MNTVLHVYSCVHLSSSEAIFRNPGQLYGGRQSLLGGGTMITEWSFLGGPAGSILGVISALGKAVFISTGF